MSAADLASAAVASPAAKTTEATVSLTEYTMHSPVFSCSTGRLGDEMGELLWN
jgi:hypothetical protein